VSEEKGWGMRSTLFQNVISSYRHISFHHSRLLAGTMSNRQKLRVAQLAQPSSSAISIAEVASHDIQSQDRPTLGVAVLAESALESQLVRASLAADSSDAADATGTKSVSIYAEVLLALDGVHIYELDRASAASDLGVGGDANMTRHNDADDTKHTSSTSSTTTTTPNLLCSGRLRVLLSSPSSQVDIKSSVDSVNTSSSTSSTSSSDELCLISLEESPDFQVVLMPSVPCLRIVERKYIVPVGDKLCGIVFPNGKLNKQWFV
jgi:hypothetical protein